MHLSGQKKQKQQEKQQQDQITTWLIRETDITMLKEFIQLKLSKTTY